MKRETIFSQCRRYRYVLWREFDFLNSAYAMFIGLNPSTADERKDDPTIRRCIGFAKSWGFGALCMTNIFAFRSTDPVKMKQQIHPVGPYNDKWLSEMSIGAGIVIAAWGTHGGHQDRARYVTQTMPLLMCLGLTKEGHPRHPLYVRADQQLIRFN